MLFVGLGCVMFLYLVGRREGEEEGKDEGEGGKVSSRQKRPNADPLKPDSE